MYVLCWLRGLQFDRCHKRCRFPNYNRMNSPNKSKIIESPSIEDRSFNRHQILLRLVTQYEAKANQYGYTFRPLLQLVNHFMPSSLSDQDNFEASKLNIDISHMSIDEQLRQLLTPAAAASEGVMDLDEVSKSKTNSIGTNEMTCPVKNMESTGQHNQINDVSHNHRTMDTFEQMPTTLLVFAPRLASLNQDNMADNTLSGKFHIRVMFSDAKCL